MIEHKHLIVNGFIERPFSKQYEAKRFLKNLVDHIKMKRIIEPVAKYVKSPGNRGMTAAILIETSHIAFHIWDEQYPAKIRFDLYTCGDLNVAIVLDYLDRNLKFYDYPEWFLLDRKGSSVFIVEQSSPGVEIVQAKNA